MTPVTGAADYDLRPEPTATPRRPFGLVAWPVACAACAGLVWAGSWSVISRFIPGANPLAPEPLLGEVVAIGGACGFLVGAAAASLLERRAAAALVWGVWAGLATAAGAGLSGVAAAALRDTLPSVVGSALGFSTTGLLLGLGGYAWSRSNVPARPEDDDEGTVQTPGPGRAVIGTRRAPPGFAWAGWKFLPALAVSAASLVAAALVGPAGAAVALIAVGLLGLSVVPVLWDQERRLRELERRFRGDARSSS